MSYAEKNLIPGETLLYLTGLHWIVFVVPIVVGAFLGLIGLPLLASDSRGVGFYLSLLAAAFIGYAVVRKRAVEMAVANKRVFLKWGLLRRRTLELLLNKVESIGVNEGILGRMLGYGTVVVRGTGGTPEGFPSIRQPKEFRRQVQQRVEEREQK
ncbi:MAG TPA: PH domain-containing protein [Terriglobales bacterium]|nr:PH domain-containing protein [Terriglobales bacterium]